MRRARHVQQAMIAEERHPALRLRIRLVQRPDQSVARIAEMWTRHRMQRGDQRAGMALDLRVDAAAVGGDEIHRQQIVAGIVHARHRQLRQTRQLIQHKAFDCEARAAA
jgi:hypothetical protein